MFVIFASFFKLRHKVRSDRNAAVHERLTAPQAQKIICCSRMFECKGNVHFTIRFRDH